VQNRGRGRYKGGRIIGCNKLNISYHIKNIQLGRIKGWGRG